MYCHCTPPPQDQEVFFDTFTTPTIRKKIKRLGNQEEKESRRIWRHVTESLAGKDVEAATDAKHTVSPVHFGCSLLPLLSCTRTLVAILEGL